MSLKKQQKTIIILAYIFGGVSMLLLTIDYLTTRTLPISAQILFWFAVISPFIIQWFFKSQNKAHRKIILENRKKLFEEIPKEEIFKEGSIFVDTFEGDEED